MSSEAVAKIFRGAGATVVRVAQGDLDDIAVRIIIRDLLVRSLREWLRQGKVI